MTWLRTAWDELVALFVDDGRFAAFIVGWIVLCALALPRIGLPAGAPGALLFAGLVLILIESAARTARGSRDP